MAFFNLLSDNFKKSLKFFLYFSLICLLFPYLSLLFQPLEPFLMEFFSINISEKSWVFLIFNGLLFFLIALYSGMIDSILPLTTPQTIENAVPKEPHIADAAPNTDEQSEIPEEKIVMVVEKENVLSDTHEEAPEMIIDEDEIDEDEIDEDEVDEDQFDLEDAEELYRKCDDFIKRMKATFSCNNFEARVAQDFDSDDQKMTMSVN